MAQGRHFHGNTQDLDADGARRLVAAIVLQAVKEARKYPAARDWLAGDGAAWADELDIRPERVRAWAAHPGPLPKRTLTTE